MTLPLPVIGAALLVAQAVSFKRMILTAQVPELTPAELGRRLLGKQGGAITHRQFCSGIPGSFCFGRWPASEVLLSRDFSATRYSGLCVTRQYYTTIRPKSGDVSLRVIGQFRSWRFFRLASDRAEKAAVDDGVGTGFYMSVGKADGRASDVQLALRVARLARSALRERTIPITCRSYTQLPSRFCEEPASILADAKLAGMRRARIDPANGATGTSKLLFELWGRGSRETPTPVYVNVEMARLPRRSADPVALKAITISEHEFVD